MLFFVSGECAGRLFRGKVRPTLTLLHVAQKKNWQIPEKIQLLGYANNMDLQPTIPMLTHIRLPYAEIGAKAIDLLLAKIRDNQDIPFQTLLAPELIQGETTRNINGSKIDFEDFIYPANRSNL